MKKIYYVMPREVIEMSYPNWLDFIMRMVWRYLKLKTIKPIKGSWYSGHQYHGGLKKEVKVYGRNSKKLH